MNYIKHFSDYFSKHRILSHFIFWSVFYLLDVFKYSILSDGDLKTALLFNFSALIPQILFSYYIGYYVMPKILVKKQYIPATILFIIGIYFFAVCNRLMIHLSERISIYPLDNQESFLEVLTDFKFLLSRYIPSNFFVALTFISVKYVLNYQKIKNKELNIYKEKIESELKILKAQLNPHFLFNTLNNIYSLSIINSTKVPELISKLSEILDHILYKCNGKFVSLSSEVKLIQNYIILEKLRYEKLNINFETHIENDIEIPPLILLSLIENAFKHGAEEDIGSPEIDILVTNKNDIFNFKITNSISKYNLSQTKKPIGLYNIKKQLDLIYNNGYDLKIENDENIFSVNLQINQKNIL